MNKENLLEIEAKKLYFKNWRNNNKDKIKKHNEKFWKKKAEEFMLNMEVEKNDKR